VPNLASCSLGNYELILIFLGKQHQNTFNMKLGCRGDRATLRVIDYFAKSLKVIRNDTFELGASPY